MLAPNLRTNIDPKFVKYVSILNGVAHPFMLTFVTNHCDHFYFYYSKDIVTDTTGKLSKLF